MKNLLAHGSPFQKTNCEVVSIEGGTVSSWVLSSKTQELTQGRASRGERYLCCYDVTTAETGMLRGVTTVVSPEAVTASATSQGLNS